MNNENAPPPALLDQLIATLLAFFGVPLACALRVLRSGVRMKRRLAMTLRICRREGWTLRFAGEDDATVEARVRYVAWIAADPWAAGKHLARQLRGWAAHRHAHYVNVLCLPPRVMGGVLTSAFCFDAMAPDTS